MVDVEHFSKLLSEHPDENPHDNDAITVCRLGLKGISEGNIGVGAIIKNKVGKVKAEGYSRIFESGFRSDLHAEMVALNYLESNSDIKLDLSEHTLYSSLEPCPMCMTRIIMAGLGKVVYVCPDDDGGMVRRLQQLPPIFQNFIKSQNQIWIQADCSPALRQIAFEIWDQSRNKLDQHFKK